MELITSFLDPIISSMFHNPDKSKIFKWTDQAISEDLDVLDPSRLDCCFLLLEESSSTCPLMLNQREEEQVEKTNMSARLKSRYFRE
ncbi:hypothetical protein BJV82DRAFT_310054 [Fennellomyces sp. T-0311]|nr:hypothetical protein BJV82DRAFT_310054 [Fennellomyces sp. T-0311]